MATQSELRQRLPQNPAVPEQAKSVEAAKEVVKQMNDEEDKTDKEDLEKKTFGRTPDGTGVNPCYRSL